MEVLNIENLSERRYRVLWKWKLIFHKISTQRSLLSLLSHDGVTFRYFQFYRYVNGRLMTPSAAFTVICIHGLYELYETPGL